MRRSFLIALLSCFLFLGNWYSSLAGEIDQTSSSVAVATPDRLSLRATPQARRLVAKASSVGTVNVIVGLHLPPKLDRLSRSNPRAEAAAIARRQTAFITRLHSRSVSKRFATMPALALSVTASELRRLLSDPAVRHVYEDISLSPTLAESTAIIRAKALWTAHQIVGGGQVVAILDTGVAVSHPMLGNAKIVSEACYSTTRGGASPTRSFCPDGVPESTAIVSGSNCPVQFPKCEHGTLVASIAAGSGGGLNGVAPGARIIAIQVASRHLQKGCEPGPAPCAAFVLSDVIKGLERVFALRRDFRIAAVNLSLASGHFDDICDNESPELQDIVRKLRRQGIATIVGAGNDKKEGEIAFPACLSDVIAVGATDKADMLWQDSNHSVLTKLLAPGVQIKAAVPEKTTSCTVVDQQFCVESGTSLAAPHVAGAWALLKSASLPALGRRAKLTEILAALNCEGESIPGLSPSHQNLRIPRPRIDVLAAYNRLRSPATAKDFLFNSGANVRRWVKNLGPSTRAGGNLATNTSDFSSSSWAVASIPYCSAAFEVTARMQVGDPHGFDNYPLDTGLLLASHITEDPVSHVVRTDGYLFYITDPSGSSGDGSAVVKRLSNRTATDFQAGDHEVEMCNVPLATLDVTAFHRLSAGIDADGHYTFKLDDTKICEFNERRFSPPSRIALVVRRYSPLEYVVFVDRVTVTPAP